MTLGSPEQRKQEKAILEQWEKVDKPRWEPYVRKHGHSPPILNRASPSSYPLRRYCLECKRVFVGREHVVWICHGTFSKALYPGWTPRVLYLT
jgi:hypothetical protein